MEMYSTRSNLKSVCKNIKEGVFSFYSRGIEMSEKSTSIFKLGLIFLLTFEILSILITIYIYGVVHASNEWADWAVEYLVSIHNIMLFALPRAHILLWVLILLFWIIFLLYLSSILWYSQQASAFTHTNTSNGLRSEGNHRKLWTMVNKFVFMSMICIEKTLVMWGYGLMGGILGHTINIKNHSNKLEISEDSITDVGSIEYYFLALFCLLTLLIVILMCCTTLLLGKAPKPDSHSSISFQNIYSSFLKLLLKLYVVSFLLSDSNYDNFWVRVIPPLVAVSTLVIYKFIYPPNQQFAVAYANTTGDTILFVTHLGVLIAQLIGMNSLYNIILTISFALILSGTSIFIYSTRRNAILRNNMIKIRSPTLCFEAIVKFNQILAKQDKTEILTTFTSMAYLHATCSTTPLSSSRTLINHLYNKRNVEEFMEFLSRKSNINSISTFFIKRSDIPENLNHEISDSVAHRFLMSLFKYYIENFPKSIKLKITLAYFNLYVMGHSFAALKELSLAENSKPSLRYQFEIFHLRKMIEAFHLRGFIKAKNQVFDHVDTLQVLQYTQNYNFCISLMKQASAISVQFWSLFLKDSTTGALVSKFGHQLILLKRQITKRSEVLINNFGFNLHFLYKFVVFQQRVIHNEQFTYELVNKIKNIAENNKVQKSKNLITSTSKQIIIRISGERRDLGGITGINEDANFLLEYEKGEIMGRNIDILMPPLVGIHHNKYMEHFLETAEFRRLNSTMTTYVRNKRGFYLAVQLVPKVVPYFEENKFNFFAICKEARDVPTISGIKLHFACKPMIFLCDWENKIIGTNEACQMYLKLTLHLSEHAYKYSLNEIFPHFLSVDFEEKVLRDVGEIFTLDPRALPSDLISERTDFRANKFLLWGKMTEIRGGTEDVAVWKMKIFTICWIINENELAKLNSIIDGDYLKRKEKKIEKVLEELDIHLPEEDEGSQLVSSVGDLRSASSTSYSQRKYILDFKKNIEEHHYTSFLKNFKRYVIISMFLLVILNLIGFFIITNKMNNTKEHFSIILDTAERLEHTITINNQLLGIVVCFSFLYETQSPEFIDEFYRVRRLTLRPEVDGLKSHVTNIEKITEKLPNKLQDIEDEKHELSTMTPFDKEEINFYSLSIYLELLIGKLLKLLIPKTIYPIIEECKSKEYVYGCQYMRDLYYVYVNIYQEIIHELDNTLSTYIETYLAKSENEQIVVLLLVASGILFVTISSIVIIIQTILISMNKAKFLSHFAFIKSQHLVLILENIYYLELNKIWFTHDFQKNVEKIFDMNENIIQNDQDESKIIGSEAIHFKALERIHKMRSAKQSELNSFSSSKDFPNIGIDIRMKSKYVEVESKLGADTLKNKLDSRDKDFEDINKSAFVCSPSTLTPNSEKIPNPPEDKGGKALLGSQISSKKVISIDEGKICKFSEEMKEGEENAGNIIGEKMGLEEVNEYDIAEEETAKQKEKSLLKMDKSLLKQIFVKILCAGALWSILFGLHITLITSFYVTFEKSSEIFKSLAMRRSALSAMNHLVWMSMVLNDTERIEDDYHIDDFKYYVDLSLKCEEYLTETQKLESSAFKGFLKLQQEMNSAEYMNILEGFHEYSAENADGYSCRIGHNGITSKGLRHSVYGYINTIINFRNTVLLSNRTTEELANNWLNSEHFGSYLFMFQCLTPAISYLIEVFMDDIGNYFEYSHTLELSHLIGIFVLTALIYLLLFSKIIKSLQKELWVTQEMMNLIPLQVTLGNPRLLVYFIPNKDKYKNLT